MKKNIIYEILICILAFISVIFAIIDINGNMSKWMMIIDNLIYAFFIVDYFARLILSKNKKAFFKSNILDLIAIMPFSSALRIFRIAKFFRILKLAKLSKLARFFALLCRMLSRCKVFINTNGFKYMLIFSGVLILISGVLISFFEDIFLTDGIWWAFVTATTVGYGDISPSTSCGRIVACILMICGIGLIGSITSTITSFFINSEKKKAPISNDRIDMVLKLYNELNDSEKEVFKNEIK
ncbi:MAG: potassium channel family protein [Agathobacter sp.]